LSKASVVVAIVVTAILAYLVGSYVGLQPLTGVQPAVSTKVVTKYMYSTLTSNITKYVPKTTYKVSTKVTTAKVTITKYVTRTNIVTRKLLTTVTKTKTKVLTSLTTTTVTKTKTQYLLQSVEHVVIAFSNLSSYNLSKLISIASKHPSLNPPSCPKVRRSLSELVIAAALTPEELKTVESIAKEVKVPNSPLDTALNAARWVYRNVKYVSDGRFKTFNCVLMPGETLRLGGDCEDRALLLASILLATKQFNKVYILSIKFKETNVGHVEVGIDVGGELYALMTEKHPFLRSLSSDYCGYWRDNGLTISNVTVYEVVTTGFTVRVGKLGTYEIKCSTTYPPPITEEYLKSIEEYLLIKFNLSKCYVPSYVWEQYRLVDEGVIYLPYLRMTIPVDWYSVHPPKWVANRVAGIIAETFSKEVSNLVRKYGCGIFKAVFTKRKVSIIKYNRYLQLYETKELKPVIDVYFIAPLTKYSPNAVVNIGSKYIVINVVSLNKSVEVLIYRLKESTPILGIAKPGWVYSTVPTVTADEWVSNSGLTHIVVNKEKVFNKLGTGKYVLVVWVGKEAYVKYLPVP